MSNPLDQLCIYNMRFLSVDAVLQANSGHLGMLRENGFSVGHICQRALVLIKRWNIHEY